MQKNIACDIRKLNMEKKKTRKKKENKKELNKEKRHIPWMPLLILIAAFLVGAFLYTNNTESARLLRAYFDMLNNKDYEGAYSLVETNLSKDEFVTKVKDIYETIDAKDIQATITSNSQMSNETNESQVSFTNSMNTIMGRITFGNSVKIKRSDTGIKLVFNSSLIFPELKEDERVNVETVFSKRGNIYDRNGMSLAKNGEIYEAGIVVGKTDDTTDYQKLASLLEINVDDIYYKLDQDKDNIGKFIYLKSFSKDRQDIKQELLKIKGILIKDKYSRVYPYKEALSCVTGYVLDSDGMCGIEYAYNKKLKGEDGIRIYAENKNQEKTRNLFERKAKDGEDIKLTIDGELQEKVYNIFKDSESAVVIMDYRTGELLTLVSTPTYDANKFIVGLSEEEWNNLQNDKKTPLFTRYLASYAPGSSIKPIVASIGLSRKDFTAEDDFGKSTDKWQKDESWKDMYITTLETYDEVSNLRNALIYSDNIYFAKAAIKIGINNFKDSLDKLGFNKKIEYEEDIKESTYGNIDSELALANSGFGQNEMKVNPIHMGSLYSAFVNEGNMVKPYIIYKDVNYNDLNNSSNKNKKNVYNQDVITKEIADIIKEDLKEVVEKGTARDCKIEGKTIYGKTGTAEIKKNQEDENGEEIGWFDSFDDNNHLIIAMCENVKTLGGSHYVVNKVRNIYESF